LQINCSTKKINSEKYLVDICPYIHLNPTRAGFADKLENWDFSNYQEWIGLRYGLLYNDEILNQYFRDGDTYKKYVENFNDREITKYLFSKT